MAEAEEIPRSESPVEVDVARALQVRCIAELQRTLGCNHLNGGV